MWPRGEVGAQQGGRYGFSLASFGYFQRRFGQLFVGRLIFDGDLGLRGFKYHDGHVVGRASVESFLDEVPANIIKRLIGAQEVVDRGVVEDRLEAIGTEDPHVAW